jgi:hypothetical protein
MKHYDEYVSLGGNCEIGFQFRRYGIEPSSLFSWLVFDIDKIIKAIDNDFKDFYEFDDLIPYTHNMVKSKKYGLCFHTQMLSSKSLKTNKLEFVDSIKKLKKYHTSEQNKYKYLVDKWNKLTHSKSKVAYFIKDQNYSDEKIKSLKRFIGQKYPSHKFTLIVIKEGQEFKFITVNKNLAICFVRAFSDIHYSWASDLYSWDKIFELYPLKNLDKYRSTNLLKNFYDSVSSLKKHKVHSFQLNFNIAQFYEKINFLEQAKYFLIQAKKQSSKEFIEIAMLKLQHRIDSIAENKKDKLVKNIIRFYTLDSEQDIIKHLLDNNLIAWRYDNKPIEIEIYKEVRYIRLSLQEKVSFHLDEIEAWNIEDENVAQNKSVIMSSTHRQDKPKINRNATNGRISGGASFHTSNEDNPWVVLDLENYELIKSIRLFNRTGTYFTRASSIVVEVSNNLKDWEVIFDNYAFQKSLDSNLLSEGKKEILDNIFNGNTPMVKDNDWKNSLLKPILKKSSLASNSSISKFIKYGLMFKVKSYYQMKVEIKKSSDIKSELAIVNDVVKLVYGVGFIFTLKNSLERGINHTNHSLDNNAPSLYKLFMLIDSLSKNSEEYNFILYAILCKYRANSRLSSELNTSKKPLETAQSIQESLDFVNGEGYVFTQHGIRKNLYAQFSQDNILNILDEINNLSFLLEKTFGVKHYIDSGTLLGAVRNGKFIEHDDDMDTAYISKESKYTNIWAESVMIRNYLNSLDKYNVSTVMPGLFHLKIDGKVKFKVDIFIGWLEGSQYFKFPSRPSVLKKEDMLPLKTIELHGKLLNVPNNYDKVLEHMYGKGWRTPDPTYRCPWDDRRSFFYERLINIDTQCPLIYWIENDLTNINQENIFKENKHITILSIDSTINDTSKDKIKKMIHNEQGSFFISFLEFFIDNLSNYIFVMELIYSLKSYQFKFIGKVNDIGLLVELISLKNTTKKRIIDASTNTRSRNRK